MSEGLASGGRVSGENLLADRPLPFFPPLVFLQLSGWGACRRRHCLSVCLGLVLVDQVAISTPPSLLFSSLWVAQYVRVVIIGQKREAA